MPIITKHGKNRTSFRKNLNNRRTKSEIDNAYKYGIPYQMIESPELKGFIAYKYKLGEKKAKNMRIYNGFLYIFRHNILLTSYPLPIQFIEIANLEQKKYKEKNKTNLKEEYICTYCNFSMSVYTFGYIKCPFCSRKYYINREGDMEELEQEGDESGSDELLEIE